MQLTFYQLINEKETVISSQRVNSWMLNKNDWQMFYLIRVYFLLSLVLS